LRIIKTYRRYRTSESLAHGPGTSCNSPVPLLISTGIFVFFWGYYQIHKRCGHFKFLIFKTQNSWDYRISTGEYEAGNVKNLIVTSEKIFLEKNENRSS